MWFFNEKNALVIHIRKSKVKSRKLKVESPELSPAPESAIRNPDSEISKAISEPDETHKPLSGIIGPFVILVK